jgi:asparagine synthase (glutamine-hydrolysing)
MPGIAGLCSAGVDRDRNEQALGGMLECIARGSASVEQSEVARADTMLGWVGLTGESSATHIAAHGDSVLVLDGELYGNEARMETPAANGAASAGRNDAGRLLRGYLSEGVKFFAGLEGRFSAAIWDADRQLCVLATDKFGMKPLYYCHHGSQLAVASAIKSLLTLPWVPRKLNSRGLVEFFAYGHLWNNDTFYSGVQCLAPATVATFNPRERSLHTERYWRPHAGQRQGVDQSLVALDAQLKAAVDDRSLGAAHVGVSLSGGLDARTVLGLMDVEKTSPVCVSLGMEGSLDQRSARRLAELAGCEFHTFVLGQGFLSDFEQHLNRMVDLTDGHYLSQCIVMPTLPLYEKLGVRTLLRGHAGELVHLHKAYNFSVDDSIAAVRDLQALHDWMFPRLQSHLTEGVAEPILCGVSNGEFGELAHESLKTALDETVHWDHPVDRLSQVFLDQRMHRETAMSLTKIGSVAEVRVPYLDGRFVEAAFSAPVDLRIGERVQTYMLRKRRPSFLQPANSNTGAPVGASALRRELSYYRMKVLAKLGVKGYQPYERLGLWLRRELKPFVEGLLLSPSCLDRGVLEPNAVRGVVRRHLSGERNHTFLVMAMMILETGFRRLLDGADEAPPARAKILAADAS